MNVGALKRVYHLNCGTFRPWPSMTLVTHVLACEMEHGLVLVDVGIGSADIASPTPRLGRSARLSGAQLRTADTAAVQIEQLGFARTDVTDVVATHLDYDHIGGLADFPNATLHTTAAELAEARTPQRTTGGNWRYRRAHIDAITRSRTYTHCDAEILGLSGHSLNNLDGMYLLPIPGHTRGHAAVALRVPGRDWLVHAGDAFMHRDAVTPPSESSPSLSGRAIRAVEMFMATDRTQVRANHRALMNLRGSAIRLFCSHDAQQFNDLRHEQDTMAPKL